MADLIKVNIERTLSEIRELTEVMSLADGKAELPKVELIAVTKNHPVEALREAIAAGITNVGENRVQEAKLKYESLALKERQGVKWHLIGHLQTNKARDAVKIFDLIHSLDSIRLAEAIDREARKIGKIQAVLIQLNLAKETSKTGLYREDLARLLTVIDNSPNLCLKGFMCIAPHYDNVEECRKVFSEMQTIFKHYRANGKYDIRYLSMGMSNDYRVAIEEGANLVRLGTLIFGARKY